MSYLERIVSLYLDYAELQAERKIPMSMEDAIQLRELLCRLLEADTDTITEAEA